MHLRCLPDGCQGVLLKAVQQQSAKMHRESDCCHPEQQTTSGPHPSCVLKKRREKTWGCLSGMTSHAATAAGCSPAVQAQVCDALRLQHVCLNNVQQAAQLGKHQHAVGRPRVACRAG